MSPLVRSTTGVHGQCSVLPLIPCRKLAERSKIVLEHGRIVLEGDELGSGLHNSVHFRQRRRRYPRLYARTVLFGLAMHGRLACLRLCVIEGLRNAIDLSLAPYKASQVQRQ